MNTFHLAGAAIAAVAALAAQQQFQADSSRSMSYVDLGPSQDVHDMVCADFDGDGVLDLVDVATNLDGNGVDDVVCAAERHDQCHPRRPDVGTPERAGTP